MKKHIRVPETVIREKVGEIICDCCHEPITDPYYMQIDTGHHDWAEDSSDSIEVHEVHDQCILKYLGECLADPDFIVNYPSRYFNIEHVENETLLK